MSEPDTKRLQMNIDCKWRVVEDPPCCWQPESAITSTTGSEQP